MLTILSCSDSLYLLYRDAIYMGNHCREQSAVAKGVAADAPLPPGVSTESGVYLCSSYALSDFCGQGPFPLPALADRALLQLESSVHIGQEPDRDPALYPA